MRVGDRDGHGRYGHLDEVNGRLVCHECGLTWKHLATHLAGGHAMTADAYRVAHGLPLSIPLVASSVSRSFGRSGVWASQRLRRYPPR